MPTGLCVLLKRSLQYREIRRPNEVTNMSCMLAVQWDILQRWQTLYFILLKFFQFVTISGEMTVIRKLILHFTINYEINQPVYICAEACCVISTTIIIYTQLILASRFSILLHVIKTHYKKWIYCKYKFIIVFERKLMLDLEMNENIFFLLLWNISVWVRLI